MRKLAATLAVVALLFSAGSAWVEVQERQQSRTEDRLQTFSILRANWPKVSDG